MPNLLDVDPTILERNLLFNDIQEDDGDISADTLFNIKPKEPNDIPWKPVKPNPGYCVKLRTHEGDKVFVNVCHTDALPEPEEISEDKLLEMIMDDDVPTFRIPISIGDLHVESDKARNPCSVYDIAVNSKFFKKMDNSEVFNTFFLNVSIQALQEKYSLDLDLKSEKPFLLLKNRKVLGNLQIHRIQQREVKKAPGQLIQEIATKPADKKNLIEVVSENETQEQDKAPAKSQLNQPKPSTQQINKQKEPSTQHINKQKEPSTQQINKQKEPSTQQLNKQKEPSTQQIYKQKEPSTQQINKQKGNSKKTTDLEIKQKVTSKDASNINEIQSSAKQDSSSNYVKPNKENHVSLPTEDSEKGMKESQLTKDNALLQLDASRLNVNRREQSDVEGTPELEQRGEVGQGERQENCSGLFCLKQHPEKGFPQILFASLRLNVKSSKDFDLELDTNRISITVNGSEKPWFDVSLPYNIDVNKVEACFVTESQKLLIKMDVIKT